MVSVYEVSMCISVTSAVMKHRLPHIGKFSRSHKNGFAIKYLNNFLNPSKIFNHIFYTSFLCHSCHSHYSLAKHVHSCIRCHLVISLFIFFVFVSLFMSCVISQIRPCKRQPKMNSTPLAVLYEGAKTPQFRSEADIVIVI